MLVAQRIPDTRETAAAQGWTDILDMRAAGGKSKGREEKPTDPRETKRDEDRRKQDDQDFLDLIALALPEIIKHLK